MKRERRAAPIHTRAVAEHPHGGFTARVVHYGLPADQYGTIWQAGFANDALAERMPVLAWGHSWTEPLGRAVRHWEEDDGLYMEFAFDDPEAVPRARQARAQVESGTLTDVSIGFERLKWEKHDDGTETMIEAGIDEVSIVLRGAVSGAQVLAVRSGAVVPAETVAQLAAKLVTNDIDIADFLAEVKAASFVQPTPKNSSDGEQGSGDDEPTSEELEQAAQVSEALESDLDAALDLALGRSRRR